MQQMWVYLHWKVSVEPPRHIFQDNKNSILCKYYLVGKCTRAQCLYKHCTKRNIKRQNCKDSGILWKLWKYTMFSTKQLLKNTLSRTKWWCAAPGQDVEDQVSMDPCFPDLNVVFGSQGKDRLIEMSRSFGSYRVVYVSPGQFQEFKDNTKICFFFV